MCKDIFLRGNVLRHVPVHIQVIGGQIGEDSDMRTLLPHGQQLEGAELQHRDVLVAHLPRLRQQRMADIAAQVDGPPRPAQKLGDDGSGRGLAVAAGDADNGTRADPEEHLHLRGDLAAVSGSLQQLRHVGPHTGSAEDDILPQALQVVRSQVQADAHGLQVVAVLPQVLPALFVAGRDGHAGSGQRLDQRPVGHADADDRHRLLVDGIQIFGKSHMIAPFTDQWSRFRGTAYAYIK